ncbi:DeoR/GlpR family DNA-binding transcription regulator [Pseudonocardia halophobica]|uniref:Lactose phosphotransferase system repressor n=1 Tax=Pseudonocardia halophobica TaxID=29401 RepID=A0A9W6L8E5_9PSEU|nr:DeoR/GlpR family DNA-binding transcription regulator [Pseudonocardia halophobica]GLL14902.1 GntR family transcriptional regulator [Pseudonocardia halophobica]
MSDPGARQEGVERRSWILTRLRSLGFLSVADLARELGVTPMTVRRDLHALESAGQVRMVHGGAALTPGELHTPAFPEDGHSAGRLRVAERAATSVDDGDTIAVDAGPTALALAGALRPSFCGSLITHSMPVLALMAARRYTSRTVALGGELLGDRHAFVGPATEAALDRLRARTFFFAPSAVDARGTYAHSPAEASVQRKLAGIADEVVLVATTDVFVASAPARVTDLAPLHRVVTDRPPPPPVAAALRAAKVPLDVVGCS